MSEALNIQPIELNPIQAQPESAEPNRPRERKKRSSFQDWLDARRELRDEQNEQRPTSFHFFDELKRSLGIGEFAEPEPSSTTRDKATELDDLPPQEKEFFFAEVAERFKAAGSRLLGVTPIRAESSVDQPSEPELTRVQHTSELPQEIGLRQRDEQAAEKNLRYEHSQQMLFEVPDPTPIDTHRPLENKSAPKQSLRSVITTGLATALWSRDPYARLERRTRRHKRAIRKLTSENRELKKELKNVKRIQKKLPAAQNVTGLPSVEAKIAAIIDAKVPRPVVERREDPRPHMTREKVLEVTRHQRTAEVSVIKKSIHETANKPGKSPEIEAANTNTYTQNEFADASMERRQEPLVRANQYVAGMVNTEKIIRNTSSATNSVQFNDDKITTLKLLKTIKNTAQQKSQSEPWIATATVVILLVLLSIVIIT